MQKTLIYIDIRTKAQIRVTGSDAKTADFPAIERGQWQILCVQFVDRIYDTSGASVITPISLGDGSSYILVGDNNFTDDDNLMFKSYQSTVPFDTTDATSNRFNIEGDWIGGEFIDGEWVENSNYTADPSKGQMSIRINSDTQKFVDALGNRESLSNNLYINIKQYVSGIENPSTVAWFRFTAKNTVRDWSEATEQVPEGSALVPFIDGFLRNPIEMEFSVDGNEWHTTQTTDDNYYHFRIANTSTTWSNAVTIVKGADGEAANAIRIQYSANNAIWSDTADDTTVYLRTSADGGVTWSAGLRVKGNKGDAAVFGEVTAQIETLPNGDEPEIIVTPSGVDTAKNFDLLFKLPQGAEGKSAYEVAVDNGYEGGAEDWLKTLIGPTGQGLDYDASGSSLADRTAYDDETTGFKFAITTINEANRNTTLSIYTKQSDTTGDWSDALNVIFFGASEPEFTAYQPITFNTASIDGSANYIAIDISESPNATVAQTCIDTEDGELILPYYSNIGVSKITKQNNILYVYMGSSIPTYESGKIYLTQMIKAATSESGDAEIVTGTMYYGYLPSSETFQSVTAITADMLTAETLAAADASAVGAVALGEVPAGSFTVALVPAASGLTVKKDDGFGGQVAFEVDNGLTGSGANGATVTLNGTAYKVFGEFNLVSGITDIYINEE